jgi:threonine dehydrogenase-like Zn-dependent dehydrogenase
MVIGHECAGIIYEVGSEVKTLVPGDRVALEPGIGCFKCDRYKVLTKPWIEASKLNFVWNHQNWTLNLEFKLEFGSHQIGIDKVII